ncbi:MAG: methionyl-tRNA formyltransferase [bacterium]
MGERTVFFGTSDFAAIVLRVLAVSPYRPQLVVTPPDRRRGRGRKLSPPPAAIVAKGAGIELLQAEDLNEIATLDRIRAEGPDVGVVCAFGQLIREPLLSQPEMLNIHPSLLPRWRGAAPIERAIMSGDTETGVTIMRLAEGLDSGPIALQERTTIEPGEDFASLSGRLAEIGAVLMLRALELHERGELELADQDDGQATYAEKISAGDRRLDPTRPAVELERAVRALTPHVGAYLELEGGDRLGVREARVGEGALPAGALEPAGGELLLGCGEGVLALGSVQPPGGRPMPAEAYLRGHDVPRRAL